jgi:hypothetical protein
MSDALNEEITDDGVPTDEALPQNAPTDPNATDAGEGDATALDPDLQADSAEEQSGGDQR